MNSEIEKKQIAIGRMYVQREEPGLQGWKEQTSPSDFDKF